MPEDFDLLLRQTSSAFDAALSHLVTPVQAENQKYLATFLEQLNHLASEFKNEIDRLAQDADWSCLSIGLFGETNAGKSTLIESLIRSFSPSSDSTTGTSIGTGESDFTKKNSFTRLQIEKLTLQFIDMPGIEGHEIRYRDQIQEAVRKSHVLILVNASNKKPEQGTLGILANYVRDDAILHVIQNDRRAATSFKSSESRALTPWPRIADVAVLEQTREALNKVLEPAQLGDFLAVHGQLAFCALSYDAHGRTTIAAPDSASCASEHRKLRDLHKRQVEFFNNFGSQEEMRKGSHIGELFQLIAGHVIHYETDISQAIRNKLTRRIRSARDKISAFAHHHDQTAGKRAVAMSACLHMLKTATNGVSEELDRNFHAALARSFAPLGDMAEDIVTENFGDASKIREGLQQALQAKIEELGDCTKQIANRRLTIVQEKMRLAFDELDVAFSRRSRFEDFAARYRTNDIEVSFNEINFEGFDWSSWIGGMMKTGLTTLLMTWEMPLIALGAVVVKGLFSFLSYFVHGEAVQRRKYLAAVNAQIAVARAKAAVKLKELASQISRELKKWAEAELYPPLIEKQSQIEQLSSRFGATVGALEALEKSMNKKGIVTNGV